MSNIIKCSIYYLLETKIVFEVAGGSGGNVRGQKNGGTGGVTKLTVPFYEFINKFKEEEEISFYYVVGGKGSDSQVTGGGSGGGGGASMVAIGNWPHSGGTPLIIAGGGGGGSSCGYSYQTGGGGGGGNNPGQDGTGGQFPGKGGGNGQGGGSIENGITCDNLPNTPTVGGPADPNLIDICGGGGGSWCGPGGSGGGTGGPGQSSNGDPNLSAYGGYGYQGGGGGGQGFPTAGMGSNDNYSGANGTWNGGASGGYGGGGAGGPGADAGGGGGYGGGAGGRCGAAGGGGGYCITSIGSYTFEDYTLNCGNIGDGYVRIYLISPDGVFVITDKQTPGSYNITVNFQVFFNNSEIGSIPKSNSSCTSSSNNQSPGNGSSSNGGTGSPSGSGTGSPSNGNNNGTPQPYPINGQVTFPPFMYQIYQTVTNNIPQSNLLQFTSPINIEYISNNEAKYIKQSSKFMTYLKYVCALYMNGLNTTNSTDPLVILYNSLTNNNTSSFTDELSTLSSYEMQLILEYKEKVDNYFEQMIPAIYLSQVETESVYYINDEGLLVNESSSNLFVMIIKCIKAISVSLYTYISFVQNIFDVYESRTNLLKNLLMSLGLYKVLTNLPQPILMNFLYNIIKIYKYKGSAYSLKILIEDVLKKGDKILEGYQYISFDYKSKSDKVFFDFRDPFTNYLVETFTGSQLDLPLLYENDSSFIGE